MACLYGIAALALLALGADLVAGNKPYYMVYRGKTFFPAFRQYAVYVGDGLSDRCPCTYSELVFAKGDLLDFCKANDVDHVEFKNFRDVERELVQRFVLNESLQEGEGVGGL